MAEPNAPYFVSFHTERVPTSIGHLSSSSGPRGQGVDRAGHTSIRQRARVSFMWDNGAERADGMVSFFARSVNVYFRLEDFVVSISSDYLPRSCAYEATRRHEFESHIMRPMRIFHSHREILITRLNSISVPTERSPVWTLSQAITGRQNSLEQRVVQAVAAVKGQLRQALEADRRAQDSPSSYRLVYQQCSAEEWAQGR